MCEFLQFLGLNVLKNINCGTQTRPVDLAGKLKAASGGSKRGKARGHVCTNSTKRITRVGFRQDCYYELRLFQSQKGGKN